MKVVILCGGLGTRLREETEFRPKSMVEIGGRPILWHIMKIYMHYGFNEFVLCLGYKGEMIKEFFNNYEILNNDFTIELGHRKHIEIHANSNAHEKSWKVTLVETGDKAMKGARLKKIEKYIDGDEFMMTYGDGVASVDVRALLAFHHNHGKLATLTGVNPVSRFGELKVKGDQVQVFREKPDDSTGLVNGGFLVFNRRIFNYLTEDDNCDLEIGPMETICQQGQLMVYKHTGAWFCMDTIRDVEHLNHLWASGKAGWKVW
ncbi:MAG: glucose-1-phosphate cytidylyltransferase [Candidatus Omnitrophica bacterium]|nr:glucose-1-phosphate cytidylyltransferase [Candidatus Omnitrophota bacterium]